jgi:hypothetical protein
MNRAGSTVHYQIACEIVESSGAGVRLGSIVPEQFPRIQADCRQHNQILVIKCHGFIEAATALCEKNEAKAIYVYRDVRDVIVSMMNKRARSFWPIVLLDSIGIALDNYYLWNGISDVLVSRYEAMVKNLEQEVHNISKYLGISLEETKARRIAEKFP